jgi:hypothetical protein
VYFCVLCLIVVSLPAGRTLFAFQLNNNNNNNNNKCNSLIRSQILMAVNVENMGLVPHNAVWQPDVSRGFIATIFRLEKKLK